MLLRTRLRTVDAPGPARERSKSVPGRSPGYRRPCRPRVRDGADSSPIWVAESRPHRALVAAGVRRACGADFVGERAPCILTPRPWIVSRVHVIAQGGHVLLVVSGSADASTTATSVLAGPAAGGALVIRNRTGAVTRCRL